MKAGSCELHNESGLERSWATFEQNARCSERDTNFVADAFDDVEQLFGKFGTFPPASDGIGYVATFCADVVIFPEHMCEKLNIPPWADGDVLSVDLLH